MKEATIGSGTAGRPVPRAVAVEMHGKGARRGTPFGHTSRVYWLNVRPYPARYRQLHFSAPVIHPTTRARGATACGQIGHTKAECLDLSVCEACRPVTWFVMLPQGRREVVYREPPGLPPLLRPRRALSASRQDKFAWTGSFIFVC